MDKITAEYLIEQLGGARSTQGMPAVGKTSASTEEPAIAASPEAATKPHVLGSWRSNVRLTENASQNTVARDAVPAPQPRERLTRPNASEPWRPIDDLPLNWETLVNPSVANQMKAWMEQAEQLKNTESYKEFLVRLRREWAIETGILERLYTISEGATKTLIEKGLDAAYLSHTDTDKRPEDVIAMIQDQEEAINGLEQFVIGQVPLTVTYIRQLHTILTQHQETYEAVNALGQTVFPNLKRGEWKELPNSLGGADGVQFAPPLQVESEMERLVTLHQIHESQGVPPDVEAAWLHHAFTIVHPFVDGNGRVARCLATLVFLKARWFPLVITRVEREPYISALRKADAGDLKPLVELFGSLQSKAIRQAFSLSEETRVSATKLKSVLASVRDRIRDLRTEQEKLKEQLIKTADTLHVMLVRRLKDLQQELQSELDREEVAIDVVVQSAKRDDAKSDYHSVQIIQYAKAQHYFANRGVYQAWALLKFSGKRPVEILFSFHGVGKSNNMLACAAMVYSRFVTDKGVSQIGDVVALSDEPFQFTSSESPNDVLKRFTAWVEDRVVGGLNYWQKALEL